MHLYSVSKILSKIAKLFTERKSLSVKSCGCDEFLWFVENSKKRLEIYSATIGGGKNAILIRRYRFNNPTCVIVCVKSVDASYDELVKIIPLVIYVFCLWTQLLYFFLQLRISKLIIKFKV